MAIIAAFSMMGVFFIIGLYVAGALGVLSLVMMQMFSDAPLWNILGNKAWESNTNFILVAVPSVPAHGRAHAAFRHGRAHVRRAVPVAGLPARRPAPHQHCLLRGLRRVLRFQRGNLRHHQPRLPAVLPAARLQRAPGYRFAGRRRNPRHPHPAQHRPDHLRRAGGGIHRPAVHGRIFARIPAGFHHDPDDDRHLPGVSAHRAHG